MGSEKVIRKRYTFYGRVQGVGFRWLAKQAADEAGVTGWVRNEYDGSVVMEIQGTSEQIDAVLLAIKRGRYLRIEEFFTEILPIDPKECRFRTEYGY